MAVKFSHELEASRLMETEFEICFLNTDSFIASLGQPSRTLFDGLFASRHAAEIANLVARFIPVDRKHLSDFRSVLAGRVFEELAYPYVANYYPDRIVLSGIETSTLFKRIYPGYDTVNYYGLEVGIAGRSYPDFLVLNVKSDSILLEAICECKLTPSLLPSGLRQAKSYSMIAQGKDLIAGQSDDGQNLGVFLTGALLHELRPKQLPNRPLKLGDSADIVYVVPQNSALKYPGIQLLRIPITTGCFREFISCFLADCQKGDFPDNRTL